MTNIHQSLSINDQPDFNKNYNKTGDKPKTGNMFGNRKITQLTKAQVEEKLVNGKYVPFPILQKFGLEMKYKSIKQATTESMARETSPFAKAKPVAVENINPPTSVQEPNLFPKKSLTRLLTGDVKPEWIVGLGKMKNDKVTPLEGYKDVFVSSLEEYERKGINFDPNTKNDPLDMAEKLDLKGTDLDKVKTQGAWLIEIHPSSKLAIPSERKSQWNPEYIEGGYTKSEQQEWITPNVGLDAEARAGRVKIFKMDTQGKTVEWKFFQGKLLPDYPPEKDVLTGKNVLVEGSWREAVEQQVAKTNTPKAVENLIEKHKAAIHQKFIRQKLR